MLPRFNGSPEQPSRRSTSGLCDFMPTSQLAYKRLCRSKKKGIPAGLLFVVISLRTKMLTSRQNKSDTRLDMKQIYPEIQRKSISCRTCKYKNPQYSGAEYHSDYWHLCTQSQSTPAWSSQHMLKLNGLFVSDRMTGSVWPPVFTHKQCNLQPDQPVWVWLPVSHSLATHYQHKHRLQRAPSVQFPACYLFSGPFHGTMLIRRDK